MLPSRFPNLLVNGSQGIAVGMATNIPPHNLREVVGGLCAMIDDPDIDLPGLMEHIKGPDFPTGGIIMGRSGIRAAYATGRGKIHAARPAPRSSRRKNGRFEILITEIPYMVNKTRLIESIADLVKDKRIEGISDLNDEKLQPHRHEDRHRNQKGLEPPGRAQPAVPLHPAAGHRRRHHAGAGRRRAAHHEPENHDAALS